MHANPNTDTNPRFCQILADAGSHDFTRRPAVDRGGCKLPALVCRGLGQVCGGVRSSPGGRGDAHSGWWWTRAVCGGEMWKKARCTFSPNLLLDYLKNCYIFLLFYIFDRTNNIYCSCIYYLLRHYCSCTSYLWCHCCSCTNNDECFYLWYKN